MAQAMARPGEMRAAGARAKAAGARAKVAAAAGSSDRKESTARKKAAHQRRLCPAPPCSTRTARRAPSRR